MVEEVLAVEVVDMALGMVAAAGFVVVVVGIVVAVVVNLVVAFFLSSLRMRHLRKREL